MTQPFDWTDEADAILIQMRAAKAPFSAIADQLGCTTRHAEDRSGVLRKAGVDVWTGKSNRLRTPELIAKIQELARHGMSQRAIGIEVGVCQWTVGKWLKRKRAFVPAASAPVKTEPVVKTVARGTFGMEAIPSGHPLSWGAITAGTVLDGVEYPAL